MAEPDKAAAETPEEVAAAAAAAAEALRPIIIVKKIIADDGHAGAHGGAWKIALADMMTAMMAFFLLMWLLGASNEEKRKSVADYFRPASHSQIVFGEVAGSNGLFGGKSIIDTDGFPFTAKQSALLERLTPQAQGGPAESFGSSKEENNKDGQQSGRLDGRSDPIAQTTAQQIVDSWAHGQHGFRTRQHAQQLDLVDRTGRCHAAVHAIPGRWQQSVLAH